MSVAIEVQSVHKKGGFWIPGPALHRLPTAYDGSSCYDARTARRAATVRGAGVAFAAFARAMARVRVAKLRSSAFSTRPSMDSAVSRITSEISDTIRNFARSSIRFSRNDRLFGTAQQREAFQHIRHVVDRAGPHLVRVVFESTLPVLVVVDFSVAERVEQPFDLFIADGTTQADAVDVVDRHEHGRFVGNDAKMIETAGGTEDGFLFDTRDDAEPLVGVNDLVSDLECHSDSPVMRCVMKARNCPRTSFQYTAENAQRTTKCGKKTRVFAISSPLRARCTLTRISAVTL